MTFYAAVKWLAFLDEATIIGHDGSKVLAWHLPGMDRLAIATEGLGDAALHAAALSPDRTRLALSNGAEVLMFDVERKAVSDRLGSQPGYHASVNEPIEQGSASPRPLTRGQRIGIWVGFHGWLIGIVLATLPDTGAFLGPLLVGWALTVIVALGFEVVARRTRDTTVKLGSVAIAMGLVLVYYSLAVEPALQAYPPAMERVENLGSVTHLPAWVGAVVVGVGAVMLLRCFARQPDHA